jgi:hypothetical protein
MGCLNALRRGLVSSGGLINRSNNNLDKYNNKVITLSPGGFKGFYMLGVCKYIKENYDLSEYIFSGASAGAWNALFLSFKGDINEFEKGFSRLYINKINNLHDLERKVKTYILSSYSSEDFELDKIFIGITVFEKFRLKTVIYTGFNSLEDAVNCCVASSHIPLITGGLRYFYNGLLSFDGGFSEYPYINNKYADIHLTPSIWKGYVKKNKQIKSPPVISFTDVFTLLSRKSDIPSLINEGYTDAIKNREHLNKCFE